MKDYYYFPAIFSIDSDGISVEFPDLPGCLTCGHSEEEAFRMAKKAVQLHLYGMEQDKEDIPEPSKISDIKTEKKMSLWRLLMPGCLRIEIRWLIKRLKKL